VILLRGGLGAGKTVLVKGLAEGLGAGGEVVSPTFVLVRHHRGRLELVHADLYRLDARREIEALGVLELAPDGVLALEWAERAPWLEAPGALEIVFNAGAGPQERDLDIVRGPGHLLAVIA
jgi:tRNA threonylcarbamoyladenosine biosynthesis protein TsaE